MSHHTNDERVLYHAVNAAYWACHRGDHEAAAVFLQNALSVYEP
jgi:hypothetical protein